MRKVFFLSFLLSMPIALWAQSSLLGVVRSKEGVLPNATLSIEEPYRSVITDEKGKFSITHLPQGSYTLRVQYLGFKTREIPIEVNKQHQSLDIVLEHSSILTDEVRILGNRAHHMAEATYSNVNAKRIEKLNYGQDVPAVLNPLPSVVFASDAGNGVGYTYLRVRGSDGTAVNVTVNGIPFNDSESHVSYFVNIPDMISSANSVQLQRGVGTSSNGAGAFGASLNIQTGQLVDTAFVEINNAVGSFNTLKSTLRFNTGLLKDKWMLEGRMSNLNSDGYIDRAFAELRSYYLSGAYYGKKDVLRFNTFSGHERTYQAWGGVPADTLAKGNRTYNGFTYANQVDNYTQDHYQLLYDYALKPSLLLNTALHYTYGRGYYEEYGSGENLAAYRFSDTTKSDLVRQKWLRNHFYGGIYALKWTPSTSLALVWGGGYNEYRGQHFGKVIWVKSFEEQNMSHRYYDDDAVKKDANSYLKATWNVGRWNYFADMQIRYIRYTYYELQNNQKVSDSPQQVSLLFFNPKAGISYAFNFFHQFYANFGIANREPNRDDYVSSTQQNRPQKETLYNLETGYKWQQEASYAHLNFYSMWYENQLVRTGRLNDVGNSIRQNVSNSYRVGLEFDTRLRISSRFQLLANATYSKNKIKAVDLFFDEGYYSYSASKQVHYENVDIAFSPNWISFIELQYYPVKNTELSLGNKYVGKQYLDNTQNEARKLDAYNTTHARIAYTFSYRGLRRVQISALVNNIFSNKYASNGWTYVYYEGSVQKQDRAYYPQALLNFMLSLNVKF